MIDLLFYAMVAWTAMVLIAMWLNPGMFKGRRGQPVTARRRLAAIGLTVAAIALSVFLFFLMGEPWNAILSSTLLLTSGAAAVYQAWKHRHKRVKLGLSGSSAPRG